MENEPILTMDGDPADYVFNTEPNIHQTAWIKLNNVGIAIHHDPQSEEVVVTAHTAGLEDDERGDLAEFTVPPKFC
jgi:lactate dehydrogenase-like 2-hydroxyacid dehydrogenase